MTERSRRLCAKLAVMPQNGHNSLIVLDHVNESVLVKEHDVRLPDFIRHDTNHVDSGELIRVPTQLIVVP